MNNAKRPFYKATRFAFPEAMNFLNTNTDKQK
jgi:hypothetical protein